MVNVAQINQLIEETVSGLGFNLVLSKTSSSLNLIELFIENSRDPDSPITIDDCSFVSEHLTHLFFVENIEYGRLEVSSPGIERPLVRLQDFERFKGRRASVRLQQPILMETGQYQRNFKGDIVGVIEKNTDVKSNQIVLNIDGKQLALNFTDILRANLAPKF